MLGLEFGDQVPAFKKLLQFLQKKNTSSHKTTIKLKGIGETMDERPLHPP